MTVDVKLIAVSALPLAYFFALLHLGFWLHNRQHRVHLHWAVVNSISAIGATLIVARTAVPLWVSTSLANTVLIASAFLLWVSMAQFAGRAAPLRIFAVATVLFFVMFQSLWSLGGDLGLRVLLVSMSTAVINAGIAYELLRAQQTLRLRARAFLASLFALHALFYLFRSATAVTLNASMDFLQANGIQNLAVTIIVIKLIGWNTAGVLMVREQARKAAT